MRAWQTHGRRHAASALRPRALPRTQTVEIAPRAFSAAASGGGDGSSSSSKRKFSFSSKFPTTSESAAVEDRGNESTPQLVCGKCNSPLSPTKDLVFFKWRNGIHLSSATDEVLKNLVVQDSVETGAPSWTKHPMHCFRCNHRVGTMARVFSTDKMLFSASSVAVQMPENQSPLISLSGYPSSLLGFSMWSELILMAETQPKLKETLGIRRVDNIRAVDSTRVELNHKLLMAKDLQSLLRVVDENSFELNDVNIRTAVDRASRFTTRRSPHGKLLSTNHQSRSFGKSEAPEDDLFSVPSPPVPGARSLTLEDSKRLWQLIDETEKLVNFGVASFKNGYGLSQFAISLNRLQVGRKTIWQPLAAQMEFMVTAEKSLIDAREASLVVKSLTHLLPKETRSEDWVIKALQVASKLALSEEDATREDQSVLETLITLVHSFITADQFDEDLFRRAFEEVNNGALDKSTMPVSKRRVLKSKMYQTHLDSVLKKRSAKFQLPNQVVGEFKEVFGAQQKQTKTSSFRLHHLVSTALSEMELSNEVSFGTKYGYHVDIAVPNHRFAIEINSPDCYQAVEPGHEDEDVKALGSVDLKARHLEQSGWTVIQLHEDKFLELETLQDRVAYLNFLLEIATCHWGTLDPPTPRHWKKSPNKRNNNK